MTSKGVMNRQRRAKALIAVARAHAQQISDEVRSNLAELADDGEALPDFTLLQIQLTRYLEIRLAELVEADERHLAELEDDRDARLRRDQAASEVQSEIIELREVVSGVWGPDRVTEILGIHRPTARNAQDLERQAQRILAHLQDTAASGLPEPRVPKAQVELEAVAARLATKCESLTDAMRAEAEESRQREASQRDRCWALEVFDDVLRGVTHSLRGWYCLAHRSEYCKSLGVRALMAERIQPQNEREV